MTSLSSRWRRYRQFTRRLGLLPSVRYRLLCRSRGEPSAGNGSGAGAPRPLRIKGFPHPIWLRPKSSDEYVFDQVFVAREYDCLPDQAVAPGGLILDCGANVGYASIFLLAKYPRARLIAVEPAPDNGAVCRKNLEPFGERARLLQSAIWSHETGLKLHREPGESTEWGTKVLEAPPGQTPDLMATSIAAILAQSGFPRIDLLKMDVEGAEAVIFSEYPEWLGRVKNIVIELHGEPCAESFFKAMSRYRYDLTTLGELTVCSAIRPI